MARLVGPDPRQLIIEDLTGPLDTSARDAAVAGASGGVAAWVTYTSGGSEQRGAAATDIEIQREKEGYGCRLYGVRWRSGEGAAYMGVYVAVPAGDGEWRVGQSHSGGDGDPHRGRPWVNFGSGGEPLHFGGRVCEAPTAARVRVSSGHSVFEDRLDGSRWALIPTDVPNRRMGDSWIVEILDVAGAVLARHRLGGRSEPVEGPG